MLFIPGTLIATITFPGIVIHELAHQLACYFFKIPIYKVCYFRIGSPAGYVLHGQVEKWVHQVIISTAPFFLNSIFGSILAFPSALNMFEFKTYTVIDIILVWLGLSITMHAFPSVGDAKSIWKRIFETNTSFLIKMGVAPIVGVIFLLGIGSTVWLDLIYGVVISFVLPKWLLIATLA